MSTRISVGNGRFCYTGPTCKLHGVKQVAAARNAMLAASYKVAGSTTLVELQGAKEELSKATTAYDATSEGQETLKTLIEEADPIEGAALAKRLTDAQAYAEEFENDQKTGKPRKTASPVVKPDANGLIPLTFPAQHTYGVPTSTVEGGGYYPATVGSKYTGYRDVTAIAKDVRADLQEAQKKGYLPQGVDFSVTVEKYSGGQSLSVEVRNIREEDIYEKEQNVGYDRNILSKKARELNERVGSIAGAYNSDSTRSEVDYFQTMYYSHSKIEDAFSRGYRIKEAKLAKAKREIKPVRDDFRARHQADSAAALSSVNFTHTNSSASVGRIGDSQLFVYKTEVNGRVNTRAYDLTDVEFKDGAVAEDYVLKYAGRSVGLERKNFLKVRRSKKR